MRPSRWDDAEDAPDYTAALQADGLPVASCKREIRPPHWVKVEWTRPPTFQEQARAGYIKSKVKGEKADSKPNRVTTKAPLPLAPVKLTDQYSAANVELLAVAVIETAVRDAKAGDEEARLFLCARDGAWANSRDAWAIVAGMDTDLLHEWACSALIPQEV